MGDGVDDVRRIKQVDALLDSPGGGKQPDRIARPDHVAFHPQRSVGEIVGREVKVSFHTGFQSFGADEEPEIVVNGARGPVGALSQQRGEDGDVACHHIFPRENVGERVAQKLGVDGPVEKVHRRSDEAQRVRPASVMPLNLIVGFLPDGFVVLLDVFRKARRLQLVNGTAAIHLVGNGVDRIHHGQGVPVGYIDDLIGEDEGVAAGKAGPLCQERRNVVGIDVGKAHHLDTGMLPFEPLRI